MATRVVEWKKPYTWWKAIEITDEKVINLRLREENNLIIYDSWDNEIYVDLQLPDWIRPTDAFPVWITTGRVLVADDWDVTGTIVCFKTTSGDNIKLLYWDDNKLYIDNWTWTFKQIYFKSDVDEIISTLRSYVDAQLALKQDVLTAWNNIQIQTVNGVLTISATDTVTTVVDNLVSTSATDALSANQWRILRWMIATASWRWVFLSLWDCSTWQPTSFPEATPYAYTTGNYYIVTTIDSTTNYRPVWNQYTGTASTTVETMDVGIWDMYVYDGSNWLLLINHTVEIWFANIWWQPTDNTNLATALWNKQDTLTLPWSPTSWNLVVRWADNKTLVDGGAVPTAPSKATSSALWTIKLWSDTVQSVSAEAVSWTSNRTYAIQLNSSDQAVVNVPWENTTYSNLAAASWWTDVSLVTTGDKYDWDNKQNALSTQTAYTTQWTSTAVPTITTNTLWQVTAITETNITFPVTSVNNNTWAVTVSEFNPWWTATTGYVVTKTANWYEWAAPTWWWGNFTTTTATLTTAWWSNGEQTVNVTWVTTSNTVIVSPDPTSINDYALNSVYCSAQGSGTLTFSCNTVPSWAITVNVLIFN